MSRMVPERDSVLEADVDAVVARCEDDFRRLRGCRVFITGGTGFVGSWLLETLTAAIDRLTLDTTAVVLSRQPAAFRRRRPHLAAHPGVSLVEGDVRALGGATLARIGTSDMIIHAASASIAAGDAGDQFDVVNTIVDGAREVLRLAGRNPGRPLLLLSSGAVYGNAGAEAPVSESSTSGPPTEGQESAYGEAKRLTEVLGAVASAAGIADVKVARLFTFVGPYLPLDQNFAVGNFLADVLRGRAVEVAGDGTAVRSYLYAADLAAWLWAIAVRGEANRAYNVGSEKPTTVGDLARSVAALASSPTDVVVRSEPRVGAAPPRYLPSTLRARRELGVTEVVGLEEGLRRTLAWHRATGGRGVSPLAAGLP